jgi:hypothetical protein
MKVVIVSLLAAVACGSALYLHQRYITQAYTIKTHCNGIGEGVCQFTGTSYNIQSGYERIHPAWEDPVALGSIIGAFGLGVAIVRFKKRD